MFSLRTRFDVRANRLARHLAERRAAKAEILDLTQSNPTQAGLLAPRDVLATLADPRGLAYQPEAAGLPEARAAVAADYARRRVTTAIGRILLTASTSEAYAWLFKLLCDPDDRVLVPRPSYPLFEYLAGLESVRVDSYPLAWDGEWHMSLDDLESRIGPRTRAVVVVNPNNPTGSYLGDDDGEGLLRVCAAHGLAVVSDEVFADYVLRGDAPRRSCFAGDGPALAFSLGGLSKSCGLPQLKLGWIVVSGPAALREDALARLEIVADTYLSASTPVQLAAPRILARIDELQAPITARLRVNLERLRNRLAGSPATLLEPEGGWSAVVQVPATLTEEERVVRLLDERGVLVHPGFFFDFEREAFLVLSLLPPEDVFAEAASRIAADLVL
jgi:aspartate/methionine/tyrosine aminotransferase